jgi:hypothetical protein
VLEAGLTPREGEAFFLGLRLWCSQGGHSRVYMALTALTIVLARPLLSMITSGNIPPAMVIDLNSAWWAYSR